VQCENLVNIEVAHRSNMPHPDALRRLRAEFDVPLFGPGVKRIFIGRRRRCLDNEEEIVSAARDFGFERHFVEDLSLRDQVRLFSQAECVSGYHGAGFVNMVYAPRDCQVLEIFNPQNGTTPMCASPPPCVSNTGTSAWTTNPGCGTATWTRPLAQDPAPHLRQQRRP
jgi:capsular polysaccharide biosynthesis protein